MLCLGFESSCDDTALALVEDGRLIADVASTQADLHALFGGVVPELASREHYRLIGRLYDELLHKSGARLQDVDCLAVSRGPGLLGSLLVAVSFAKGLALGSGKKLIGVNHLHAHLLASGLEQELQFPALGVLVSGGHTQLYYIASPSDFSMLGCTLDDAAGEAFDKVAKMLNLPYPGGRLIDCLGMNIPPERTLFPRPYLDNDNLNFSFSGLKTAVSTWLGAHQELILARQLTSKNCEVVFAAGKKAVETGLPVSNLPPEISPQLPQMCSSFASAVADTLYAKSARALKHIAADATRAPVRSILLAGGVAANSRIRSAITRLAKEHRVPLCVPSPALCTDNGAMVAYAGYLLAKTGRYHTLDMESIPRGRAIPNDYCME